MSDTTSSPDAGLTWAAVCAMAEDGEDPRPGGWPTLADALTEAAERAAEAAAVVVALVALADIHAPETDEVDHAISGLGRQHGFVADQSKLVKGKVERLAAALRQIGGGR